MEVINICGKEYDASVIYDILTALEFGGKTDFEIKSGKYPTTSGGSIDGFELYDDLKAHGFIEYARCGGNAYEGFGYFVTKEGKDWRGQYLKIGRELYKQIFNKADHSFNYEEC